MQYLIMCRSLTQAQRSARLLEKSGITANVVKAPQGLISNGCSYAVSIYGSAERSKYILKMNNLLTGKIFMKSVNGEYQEV